MEITRGFNVDPSLEILPVPKCTCGGTILYGELKSFLSEEYTREYDEALDFARQNVLAGTGPDRTSTPLTVKFYNRLVIYKGEELERQYQLLREQNQYERAFNAMELRACCRGTILAQEVVPKILFNPEIESGEVDPSVEDEYIGLKYEGHMRRGQFLPPRFENGLWYADTATVRGVTSYPAKVVVEWLEAPVPLFARNILKKANENATSVILPRLPGIPDPWDNRKQNVDNSFYDLHRAELQYLAYERLYPDFREFANKFITENYGLDQVRYAQVFPRIPGDPASNNKRLIITGAFTGKRTRAEVLQLLQENVPEFSEGDIKFVLRLRDYPKEEAASILTEQFPDLSEEDIQFLAQVHNRSEEDALNILRRNFPDQSEDDIQFLVRTRNISGIEMSNFRWEAMKAYIDQTQPDEDDESVELTKEQIKQEWQAHVKSERETTRSRRIWSGIAEFI